jgi:dTDP-glucose 4,6-dehydratase
MKRLFVTGGAGFIGSTFVRLVLELRPDLEVVNFDALTYAGNPDNLKGLDGDRHRLIVGDIRDVSAVEKAMAGGVDAVVNFAAESHVDRSITSATEFLTTNVAGTQVLLDSARKFGVPRFLQVSTDEVMGSLREVESAFFRDDSPFEPNSPYAASKAAAEHLVRAAWKTHGMDVVTTRCGNNYGPRQFPEKLIPLLISNALNNEPVPVYGDGLNVRDWIYVDDHCRAILMALESAPAGSIYNIGANNPLQNIFVVKSILNALGKPHSLIRFVNDRPGHDRRYAIDPTRIMTDLGWTPLESWESGIRKTIDWYHNNSEWIGRARSGEYREYFSRQYGFEVASS